MIFVSGWLVQPVGESVGQDLGAPLFLRGFNCRCLEQMGNLQSNSCYNHSFIRSQAIAEQEEERERESKSERERERERERKREIDGWGRDWKLLKERERLILK